MSRVSGCLWLGVALVLALVAGGVAFVTLQKATVSRVSDAAPVATTSVVVAAHPIAVGAALTEKDLTLQDFPTGVLPSGVLTTIEDAAGQLTTVALNAGEMVLSHHLVTPDITGSNLSFTLPEGMVGVTLSADDLLSQVGVIQPGYKVDLMYTLQVAGTEGGGAQWTFGSLQNVTIVSLVTNGVQQPGDDANASTAAPRAYILALTPQDALLLKYLKDAGAIMDLALRNVADEGEHTTQPVDSQYLIDKFQLRPR